MKREKRLTKRERKELAAPRPGAKGKAPQHIHCIACGRHIDVHEFKAEGTAKFLKCEHGSRYAACVACEDSAIDRIAEHDRTGKPVASAGAWH